MESRPELPFKEISLIISLSDNIPSIASSLSVTGKAPILLSANSFDASERSVIGVVFIISFCFFFEIIDVTK